MSAWTKTLPTRDEVEHFEAAPDAAACWLGERPPGRPCPALAELERAERPDDHQIVLIASTALAIRSRRLIRRGSGASAERWP